MGTFNHMLPQVNVNEPMPTEGILPFDAHTTTVIKSA
jgi:hypothetical protein